MTLRFFSPTTGRSVGRLNLLSFALGSTTKSESAGVIWRSFNSTAVRSDATTSNDTPASSTSSPSSSSFATSMERQEPGQRRIKPSWSRLPQLAAQEPSQQMETSQVLRYLRSQSPHYIVIRMHDTHKYLLTAQDLLTVQHLPDVNVGDVIKFTRIVEVGSRDYTLRHEGDNYVEGFPPQIVECQATVAEHFLGPLHVVTKTKRRKRYRRTVQQRHRYTRLRVGDIIIGDGKQPGPIHD